MSRALTALAVSALAVSGTFGLAGSSTANAQTPLRTWLAAGDSFSSGEGLPHSAGRCARALPGSGSAAWSDVARDRIGSALPSLARPRLVACKGATTSGFFSSDQWQPSLGRFDLVTFTFGGNDIRFSPIINQCIGMAGDGLPQQAREHQRPDCTPSR